MNPYMGCDGYPLFPPVGQVVNEIATAAGGFGILHGPAKARIRKVFGTLSLSEIYHFRDDLAVRVAEIDAAMEPGERRRFEKTICRLISSSVRCYAATLHTRFGANPRRPDKAPKKGYAPVFEEVTLMLGNMKDAAGWSDLRGTSRAGKPWLDGFPRTIFVSDMGDALSKAVDFDSLKREIVDIVASPSGRAHVWLWLTKRPRRMAEFSGWLEKQGIPWPANLVPMTSVIDGDMAVHVKHLLKIPAQIRGLSVEPLWEDVEIDLEGIHWVIVGGESGSQAKPFHLEWARKLGDRCRLEGKSFFMKQLGAKPFEEGRRLTLDDKHGGDWMEWPERPADPRNAGRFPLANRCSGHGAACFPPARRGR